MPVESLPKPLQRKGFRRLLFKELFLTTKYSVYNNIPEYFAKL
jgi:hypothetical protein